MSACNPPVINPRPKARGSGDLYVDGKTRSDIVAGLDLSEVAVLSAAHFDKIHYQLKKREIEEERIRKIVEARQKLHQLSLEKVKDWKNTIYGQRQKRLEAVRLKEEREESERVKVDIEEAKFQAAKRQEAIEKAKKQLYYGTERVKQMHAAMLHVNALEERDNQLEINRLKKKLSKEQEKDWYERYKRDFEEFSNADRKQRQEIRRKNNQAADYQRAQIRHHLTDMEQSKDENRKEGERLQRQADEFKEELMRNAEVRRQRAIQLSVVNKNQIEDGKYMKELAKNQEEEEDEECRIFAQQKRNIMKLRQAKEHEIRDEKLEKLEKIQAGLAELIKQEKEDEDARIKRAIEEREEKRLKKEAEDEEKRLKGIRGVEEHRIEQMKVVEQRKVEQKIESEETLKANKEADMIWIANEMERLERRRKEAEEYSSDQRKQAEEKRNLEKTLNDNDLEQERRNRELAVEAENQFQDYARELIKSFKDRGKNAIPMEKAAREGFGGGKGHCFPGRGPIRPSYMVTDRSGAELPNSLRCETEQIKEKQGMDRTSKRLGFGCV